MNYLHLTDPESMLRSISIARVGIVLISLGSLCCLPLSGESLPALQTEINFDENTPQFMTSRELEIWAASRNLTLVPDNPLRGLQDGLAALIGAEGLSFRLKVPARMNYLYLDLVRFYPGLEARPTMRWLDVSLNGEIVDTIYAGGNLRQKHPVIIPVYPEHAPGGHIQIHLRPGAGDTFFAIWDAFVSEHRLTFSRD